MSVHPQIPAGYYPERAEVVRTRGIRPYPVPVALVATMPTSRLLEFARELTKQTDDPKLSRSQRAYVRTLLQPYLDEVRAELERREAVQ
jgi:hypothetical protein